MDLFGTFVFAISGVITALQKKFDLVGTLVIGFITAIGGGTLRDILIGNFPVGWLKDRNYFLVIIAGCIIAYAFKQQVLRYKKSMFLFDTIGIALFTILGIETASAVGLNTEICIIMGVVSACFGGVIRDVLTNEIPLIFRNEIYATACFIGGVCYMLSYEVSSSRNLNILISIFVVLVIRFLSIKRGWTLNFHFEKTFDS